jgi:hypothetical protein
MKKYLEAFFLLLLVVGVVCASCSISSENLNDAELFLYSIGLVCVAFIARKKFNKK